MRQHLDKLRRIDRLQKRLRDLAQWREAALAREREELGRARDEMLVALSEGLLALGGAAAAGSRRIRALEVELALAREAGEARARETLALATRSRLAGRAVEAEAARWRGDLEKKSLAELIERSQQAPIPGPRKP